MSSSTKQPVGYPSIQHLTLLIREKTAIEGVLWNLLAEEPLTREDREELNFPDVRNFIRHVELAPKEVYDSIMRLRKHLVLVDKQNQKLKSKFINYKKVNEAYIIDNAQLKAENNNLKNWLADLKKQLENAQSDKHLAPSPPPPPSVVSDNSDDNLKQSKKTKLTKLSDPPMLTNSHVTGFDINIWKSKIVKKLSANADHYLTKTLRMAYVNSHVDREAYKHLAARSKIDAQKPFTTAEKMFEVLQKAYGDVNQKHTAINKFQDLKMTKDFNSFWAKFQILALELDHNKSTFIIELIYKLISLLLQAITSGVSRPKNLHEYVQQCQLAYQDLKDIKLWTPAANFGGNWYQGTNTNTNTSIKTASQQANCNKRPANSVYSRLSFIALNLVSMRLACSKATRLTQEKIAKLQREDYCFTCKKVGNYWSKHPNKWQLMAVFTNADSALTKVNISKVAISQPGHVGAENV